jgi:SAM-dependent methyltransferase
MFFKEISRRKNTPITLRIVWKLFYFLQKVVSPERLLRILLNTVWALWRLSWEQTNIYEARHKSSGKVDILRPSNVADATTGVSIANRVCDFGGGAGDISEALLKLGCEVVYCDTNKDLEQSMVIRFGNNPRFSVADSKQVLNGDQGKFDLVIFSHVLEHIENPRDFLKKIGKITERIHIEVPDLASDPLNYIRVKLGLRVYKDDDHVIEMSLEFLRNLIQDSNFLVESIVSRDACLVARAKSNSI